MIILLTKEDVRNWIKEQLEDLCEKDKDMFYYKLEKYDYRDCLQESTILKAYDEFEESLHTKPKETEGMTFEGYLDTYCYENIFDIDSDRYLYDTIQERVNNEDKDFQKAFEELIDGDYAGSLGEAMYDCGYGGFNYDIADFVPECHINLLLGTDAERNFDMGSIADYYNGFDAESDDAAQYKEDYWENRDNALTHLLEQQGYSPEDIFDESKKSDFLNDVREELEGFTYSCATLTACVSASGKELLDLLDKTAKGDGSIEVSKDSFVGLFESWNGAGSYFGISLDKPFAFPSDMVKNIQIENAGGVRFREYTVGEVYGFTSKAWQGKAKVLDDSPAKTNKKAKNDIERD